MSHDNTNRGVLFKNDRKDTEKHPDYTGKIDIDGTEYYLSGWIKDGRNGKFMSLSRGKATGDAAPQPARAVEPPSFDDDIPF
jgi:hypothetical protein